MVAQRNGMHGPGGGDAERLAYMIEHMAQNKAYKYAAERAGGDADGKLLERFRERFHQYRIGWRGNPQAAIEKKLHHDAFRQKGFLPMCVDIETAAVCDLACPFCYRQWLATPDKLMSEDLFRRLIDQCVEMGVASIKLNRRGEPLLQPRLPEFIAYAKRAGIIETLMNSNAVTLTEEKARALIEAGLDLIIFSFDGGTKETYERMRVGRFEGNCFENVCENIQRFSRLRREAGAVFPRTKIQMIVTKDTFKEQEAFFELFNEYVDDVSVKAYTERGGDLPDLESATRETLRNSLRRRGFPDSTPYWRDHKGTLHIAEGRVACEQPYQRLMVTYNGVVTMCCFDWGAEYPVGYVDLGAFEDADRECTEVVERARSGAKGFELLSNVRMPKRHIEPPKVAQTLEEIWYGNILNDVREKHVEGRAEEVSICQRCPAVEVYRWVKI